MSRENSHVSGTVIQRTFIPENLGTVLHIATVPIEDISEDYDVDNSESFLTQVVAETVGVPHESILTQTQYANLVNFISNGEYRRLFRLARRGLFFDEFYYHALRELEGEVKALMESAEENNPAGLRLALHSLGLMANPTINFSNELLFPSHLFSRLELSGIEREVASTRESFEAGLICLSANINPDSRVRSLITELQTYEIPSGQSPATKSESLAQLIRTSRSVCLAPIIASSTIAATHLGQGGYVAALLDVATGAGATLILVSTISFAEVIARRFAENRGRRFKKINKNERTNSQRKISERKPKEIEGDDPDKSSEG
ncbi:MAG TPA: hypothetical protein VM914_07935 [Pyrinomonadaceae bacterium]|jgi:hypothetical protein|nr:hypothetical protein [Pyrinomonadaceae bacterium]